MTNAAASGEIRSTCPYCGVGCGVVVTGGETVSGDAAHPANEGRLCSKGSALGATLQDVDRLTDPLIGGQSVAWDAALDLIADRFRATIAEHGPDAVAFYVSGQCLTEDYYVANKLMKGFIGSGNIDTNSRLCMASSVAGHIRAFGEDIVPGIYEDLEQADLVVLVGSNTAWCHPVLYQRMMAARDKRGTRVVVIDPRRTPTAESADLHLALRPGSDVALFNGLLAHLDACGAIDPDWIEAHTTGFLKAVATARQTAPDAEAIARLTDIPVEAIHEFLDLFAATERVVTVYSQGVNQSSVGTDKVNAIINCHLATGRIGRPGMGPFSVTGQPNAMGGREVGGLANQLAAHMAFSNPQQIDLVRRFWQAPRIATTPGLKAVDLFEAVHDGRVKAIWIIATNPAASMPRADRVREALAACPFVVVSDCWATESTALAHVVLPAAGWGEKDGTVTNSERVISRQRAFRAAPGDARPDWWALTEVARRLGWGSAFPYRSAHEVFIEHAALSGFENQGARVFDISAKASISEAVYDAMLPFRWPCTLARPQADRLFEDGRFATPNGRANVVATPLRHAIQPVDPDFPFLLNTGRTRDQWHTMTRTGRVARLMAHDDQPVLTLHPDDAKAIGVDEATLLRVVTKEGSALLTSQISESVRRGEIFVTMHWTDLFSSAGPVDRLVTGTPDPISGQPDLKATPARLEVVPTLWQAILLRRDIAALPREMAWSRNPVDGGQIYNLRGVTAFPEDTEQDRLISRLLPVLPPGTEQIELRDDRRGRLRLAWLAEGRIVAALFLAAGEIQTLPEREVAAALLTRKVEDADRHGLLSGRAPAGQTDTGKIVCACFRVGTHDITKAIATQGLTTAAEIGRALRAGTNCGSCVPELNKLLRANPANYEKGEIGVV